MTGIRRLKIGAVADDVAALRQLQTVLAAAGHTVEAALTATQLNVLDRQAGSLEAKSDVQIWVAEISEDENSDCIDLLYDQSEIPILLGDGIPTPVGGEDFQRWQQRLVEKLLQIAEQYGLQPQPGAAALAMEGEAQRNPFLARAEENLPAMAFIKEVWVLAASLGGPEAVKQFLDCLPSDLPIALIYAQHTYDEQDQLLAQVLGRHNAWSLVTSETAESLKPGQVYVVPTDHQVRFTADGKIHNLAEAWPKPYAPTLDRVMQSVAGCFQHRCGTIVFTGMCDDGADGARAIQAAGGVVWAQTPESCACPAMPEAALETGSVTLCDEPEALARQLALRYNNSMTTIKETIADERSVVK